MLKALFIHHTVCSEQVFHKIGPYHGRRRVLRVPHILENGRVVDGTRAEDVGEHNNSSPTNFLHIHCSNRQEADHFYTTIPQKKTFQEV